VRNSAGITIPTATTSKAVDVLNKTAAKSQTARKTKRTRTERPSRIMGSAPPTTHELLRIVRAAQPISRTAVARRLGVTRGTVTVLVKPLLSSGALREAAPEQTIAGRVGRPPIGLSLRAEREFLIGINIGVSEVRIGATTPDGQLLREDSFATPSDPAEALSRIRLLIAEMRVRLPERVLMIIGVSVPGPADVEKGMLLYAPHLGWRDVPIRSLMRTTVPVVVENNATAAAIYEAQRRRSTDNNRRTANDFVLVRVGTGIGVGLVLGGEAYRGTRGADLAGEFGHMTIVAGGKPCTCGNRGCWERYASASSAVELYLGNGPRVKGRSLLRFRDVVTRAEAGEERAQATLERVGQSLGIGIGNIICGLGVSQVVLSGRILRGWKFIQKPLRAVVAQTMGGRLVKWSVEPGEMSGSSLGGAIEVAIESHLLGLRMQSRCA